MDKEWQEPLRIDHQPRSSMCYEYIGIDTRDSSDKLSCIFVFVGTVIFTHQLPQSSGDHGDVQA